MIVEALEPRVLISAQQETPCLVGGLSLESQETFTKQQRSGLLVARACMPWLLHLFRA